MEETIRNYYNYFDEEIQTIEKDIADTKSQMNNESNPENLKKLEENVNKLERRMTCLNTIRPLHLLEEKHASYASDIELKDFIEKEINELVSDIKESQQKIESNENDSNNKDFSKNYIRRIEKEQETLKHYLDIINDSNSIRNLYYSKLLGLDYTKSITNTDISNIKAINLCQKFLNMPKEKQENILNFISDINERNNYESDISIQLPLCDSWSHIGTYSIKAGKTVKLEKDMSFNKIENYFSSIKRQIEFELLKGFKMMKFEARTTQLKDCSKAINEYYNEYKKQKYLYEQKIQNNLNEIEEFKINIMEAFGEIINDEELESFISIFGDLTKGNELYDQAMQRLENFNSVYDIITDIDDNAHKLTEQNKNYLYDNSSNINFDLEEAKRIANDQSYPEIRKYAADTEVEDQYINEMMKLGF